MATPRNAVIGAPLYGSPFAGGVGGELRRLSNPAGSQGGVLQPSFIAAPPLSGPTSNTDIFTDRPGRGSNGCIPYARVAMAKNDTTVRENLNKAAVGELMWIETEERRNTQSVTFRNSRVNLADHEEGAQTAFLMSTHAVMERLDKGEAKVLLYKANDDGTKAGDTGLTLEGYYGDYGNAVKLNELIYAGSDQNKRAKRHFPKWMVTTATTDAKKETNLVVDGGLLFRKDSPFLLSAVIDSGSGAAAAGYSTAANNTLNPKKRKRIQNDTAKEYTDFGSIGFDALHQAIAAQRNSPFTFVPDGICKNVYGDVTGSIVSGGQGTIDRLQQHGNQNILFNVIVRGNVVTTTWSHGPEFADARLLSDSMYRMDKPNDGMGLSTKRLSELNVMDSLYVLLKAEIVVGDDNNVNLTKFKYFLSTSGDLHKRCESTDISKHRERLGTMEWIIGGWCIGKVVDAGASPMDSAPTLMVRSSEELQTSMGIEVLYKPKWETGMQLATRYALPHIEDYVSSDGIETMVGDSFKTATQFQQEASVLLAAIEDLANRATIESANAQNADVGIFSETAADAAEQAAEDARLELLKLETLANKWVANPVIKKAYEDARDFVRRAQASAVDAKAAANSTLSSSRPASSVTLPAAAAKPSSATTSAPSSSAKAMRGRGAGK